LLAINPGQVSGTLPGPSAKDPAFGLPATWIEANLKERALGMGYTVVDASTVVATHLNHLIQIHAAELLGRQEVQQLLDRVNKESPKAIEDLVPKLITITTLQKVLQNLLTEGVHIRDMRTVLEILAEHAPRTQDANELTAMVRIALGRAIMQQYFQSSPELQVMALNPALENILMQAMQSNDPNNAAIEPGLAESMLKEAKSAVQRQEQSGLPPVLLVPAQLRIPLSRFLRRVIPQLKVISHSEVPDSRTIKVTSLLGARA
jgi:flagellar biosynthesis protein FlhA